MSTKAKTPRVQARTAGQVARETRSDDAEGTTRRKRGRPPTGLPPRKTQLTTALTAEEANRVIAAATHDEITVSEWLRQAALARLRDVGR